MEMVLEEIASVLAKHKAVLAEESKTALMSSKFDVPVLAKNLLLLFYLQLQMISQHIIRSFPFHAIGCSGCGAIGHEVAKCCVILEDNNKRGRSLSLKSHTVYKPIGLKSQEINVNSQKELPSDGKCEVAAPTNDTGDKSSEMMQMGQLKSSNKDDNNASSSDAETISQIESSSDNEEASKFDNEILKSNEHVEETKKYGHDDAPDVPLLPVLEEINQVVEELSKSKVDSDGYELVTSKPKQKKSKIIPKIIANRLKAVASRIVSQQQAAFLKGHKIHNCIGMVSENLQLMDVKSHSWNDGLKLDITKAFDTIHWDFLLKVLKCFRFHNTLLGWIEVLLQSSRLSILINGTTHGFFSCSRGVRQGDPLSPILFCLAEEYLSRGLSLLYNSGTVKRISAPRGCVAPSHARNRIVFKNTTYSHGKIIMSCKSYLRSWSSSCPGSIYSISDLHILKAIGISANNCRAPRITQVLWLLPIYPFIKVNTDGLSKGNPGEAACGGVFRDHSGKFLGAYAVSLGHNTSFYAEIMAIIYAINQAAQRGWKFIWLESDSQAALSCLLDHSYKPPWCIYNEWINCHFLLSQIPFYCSHIFREGNQVADSMANVGLSCPTFTWFGYQPAQIKEILFKNRWGFPNF
ncbi:Ribonuclease H [Melia azedarach]|uniref:Ribonuclease H n=1 Tax=Melia azedarach TaxID=155640 RepID=A0ACC1Y240_MELAZ|nr:Ribonuclease H [Melia azedarach]